MRPSLTALVLLLLAGTAHAQQAVCTTPQRPKNLCMFVGGMSVDPEPVHNQKYVYWRRVMRAACVDIGKDTPEAVARKVSAMWQTYEKDLECNSLQFDIPNGNILKLAVMKNFDAFLHDAIAWRVDLNKVDDLDGRTVLDYTRYHMERSRGGALESRYKSYYDLLRKAGARHWDELPGADPNRKRYPTHWPER